MWRWISDPFGTTAANDDPDGDGTTFTLNLRFPGQYFDTETGLHYNYFRYYDPATGRYVTSDPIGLEVGLNTYGYVGGNPVGLVDPKGLTHLTRPIPWLPAPPPPPSWWPSDKEIADAIEKTFKDIFNAITFGLFEEDQCEEEECPPCRLVDGTIVLVGTIAYRPLDTPSNPQHGIDGPHYNIYKANRNPNNCQCFWQSLGAVPQDELPPGAIPIQPFQN